MQSMKNMCRHFPTSFFLPYTRGTIQHMYWSRDQPNTRFSVFSSQTSLVLTLSVPKDDRLNIMEGEQLYMKNELFI